MATHKLARGPIVKIKEVWKVPPERDEKGRIVKDHLGRAVYSLSDPVLVEKIEERTSQKGDWQAAAWRLERRFPDRWGRTSRDLESRIQELREQLTELLAVGGKPNLKLSE